MPVAPVLTLLLVIVLAGVGALALRRHGLRRPVTTHRTFEGEIITCTQARGALVLELRAASVLSSTHPGKHPRAVSLQDMVSSTISAISLALHPSLTVALPLPQAAVTSTRPWGHPGDIARLDVVYAGDSVVMWTVRDSLGPVGRAIGPWTPVA